MKYLEKSLEIFSLFGLRESVSRQLNSLGVIHYKVGRYNEAMSNYQKALKIGIENNSRKRIITLSLNIGEIYRVLGDYETAKEQYEKVLDVPRELSNPAHVSVALSNIGSIHFNQEEYKQAISYFEQAFQLVKDIDFKWVLPHCLIEKAETLYKLKRFEESRISNAEGFQIAQKVRPEYIFRSRVLSAKIEFALGNQDGGISGLQDMLLETEEKEEKADLSFELFELSVNTEYHRQEAYSLYQELYAKIPKHVYRQRMEKLGRKIN